MYIKKEVEKNCKECGKRFIAKGLTQIYCSDVCRRKTASRRHNPHPLPSEISTGTRGAMNELIVCADLMKKGYAVFRAVSPSCSCDLAILKDKKLLRVEVTSGWISDGKIYGNKHKEENFDVMAIVADGKITYSGL